MPRAPIITLAVTLLLSWASGLPGRAAQDSEPGIEHAQSLIRSRKYDEAIKELKRLKKTQQPPDPTCDLLLAQAYEKVRAFKNAADSADNVLRAAGGDKYLAAEAHNLKGLALIGLAAPENQKDKHLKEAEGEFRAALALTAALPAARYNLGLDLMRQGRDPEGAAELQAYLNQPTPGTDLEKVRKMIADPRRAREPFAPDFSFTTLAGDYVSSDDLRGKVVMLDFWGTWCTPCVESVPTIKSIHGVFSSKPFELISVSSDKDEGAWRKFVLKGDMNWPQYRDSSWRVISDFDVNEYPTYIVIDHEGIVRYRSSGYGSDTYVQLQRAIVDALKAQRKWAKEHPEGITAKAAVPATAPPAARSAETRTAAAPGEAEESPGSNAGATPTRAAGTPATTPARPAAPAAALDDSFPQAARGSLSGNTYRNDYFGFTLHVLSDWQVLDATSMEASEVQQMEAAMKESQPRQQSLGNQGEEPGKRRVRVMVLPHIRHILLATALVEAAHGASAPTLLVWAEAPLPQVKTTEDYFQCPEFLGQPGTEVVRQAAPTALGGKAFLRGDRKVARGGADVWTADVVSLEKDYLWGFTISASSKESIDEALGLLRSLVSSGSGSE